MFLLLGLLPQFYRNGLDVVGRYKIGVNNTVHGFTLEIQKPSTEGSYL